MYICICNAIREKDLRRAASEHDGDAESLYARLGFAPQCRQCRQCLGDAEQIVSEARTCVAA